MPNHQHKYLHRRTPEPNVWDEFLEGAADLNPFGETTKELQAKEAKGPSTVYATVYTTLEPTFSGDVGGYSTVGSDSDTTTAAAAEPTTSAEQADATSNAKATTSESDDTSLPESVVPTATADLGSESTLAVATKTSSTSSESTAIGTGATVSAAIAAASSSSTAASTSSSSSEDGSSSGAKAGIAFGVLGGLLVFGLLAWFLFNKRRKQMEQQQANDNEKINRDMRAAAIPNRRSSVMTTRTTATAPRLSLRPVTQFMPNFGERRSSRGAAMALAIAPSSSNNNPSARRPVGNGQYDRPATSQSSHQENPFGNNAERLDAVSERSVSVVGLDVHPNNPFDAPENVMAQTTNYHPDSSINSAAAAGAGVIAGAAVGTALTRKQSTRQNAPQALDFTTANQPLTAFGPVPVPASPAGTEFSMTEVDPGQSPGPSSSAAAIAAAGGPPQSTVHRVQLDFKPSMDDEIGLKAGQLVRLLHAYDDGWVCISYFRPKMIKTNNSRLSASASIDRIKEYALEHACLSVP